MQKVMPWNLPSAPGSQISSSKSKSLDYALEANDETWPALKGSDSSVNAMGELNMQDFQVEHADKECFAFLAYAQNTMREAGADCVYLFDLCLHADKQTAAQAFYNGTFDLHSPGSG